MKILTFFLKLRHPGIQKIVSLECKIFNENNYIFTCVKRDISIFDLSWKCLLLSFWGYLLSKICIMFLKVINFELWCFQI